MVAANHRAHELDERHMKLADNKHEKLVVDHAMKVISQYRNSLEDAILASRPETMAEALAVLLVAIGRTNWMHAVVPNEETAEDAERVELALIAAVRIPREHTALDEPGPLVELFDAYGGTERDILAMVHAGIYTAPEEARGHG